MRFATFVVLPLAAVLAAPGPDFGKINDAVAKSTEAINQIKAQQADVAAALAAVPASGAASGVKARHDHDRPAQAAPAPAAPAAQASSQPAPAQPGTGGTGLGSAYGDLTTLLSGLGDTLEGLCNLRTDISSLTSSFGL